MAVVPVPIAVNTLGLAALVALYDFAFCATQKKTTRAIYLVALLSAASAALSIAGGESPSSPFTSAALFTFAAALAASAFRLARPTPAVGGATTGVVLCYAVLALFSSLYPGAPPHATRVEWYTIAHPALVVLTIPATIVYAAAALLGHESKSGLLVLWTLSTATLFAGLYWAYSEPDVTILYLIDPLTGTLAALWLSVSAAVVLRQTKVPLLVATGAALAEVASARAGLSMLHSVTHDPTLAAVSLLPGLPVVAPLLKGSTRKELRASLESLRAMLRARDARLVSAMALLIAALILLAPPAAELAGLARPGMTHMAYSSEALRALLCLLAAASLAALWPALQPKAPMPLLLVLAAAGSLAAWKLALPTLPPHYLVLSIFAAFTPVISVGSLVRRKGTLAMVLAVVSLLMAAAPFTCSALVGHPLSEERFEPEVEVKPLPGTLVVPNDSLEVRHTDFFYQLITNDTALEDFVNQTGEMGFWINSTVHEIRESALKLGFSLEPLPPGVSLELPKGLILEVRAPDSGLPPVQLTFDFERFLRGETPLLEVTELRAGRFPFVPVIGTLKQPAGLGETVIELQASKHQAYFLDALVMHYSKHACANNASLRIPIFIALGYAITMEGNPLATLQILSVTLSREPPELSQELVVRRFDVPLVNLMWASAAALVAVQVGLTSSQLRRAVKALKETPPSTAERKKRRGAKRAARR